jgi:hypothetical protein
VIVTNLKRERDRQSQWFFVLMIAVVIPIATTLTTGMAFWPSMGLVVLVGAVAGLVFALAAWVIAQRSRRSR